MSGCAALLVDNTMLLSSLGLNKTGFILEVRNVAQDTAVCWFVRLSKNCLFFSFFFYTSVCSFIDTASYKIVALCVALHHVTTCHLGCSHVD